MDPTRQPLDDLLIELAGLPAESQDEWVDAHDLRAALEDPRVAARLKGLRDQASVLSGLRRLPAPEDLEQRLAQDLAAPDRARGIRAAAALGQLAAVEAPAELDGRVVAACHAGERQERATRAVRGLPRLRVPALLNRKILGPRPAPVSLEIEGLEPLALAPDARTLPDAEVRPNRRPALWAGLAAAAVLVLSWQLVPRLLPTESPLQNTRPELRLTFEVVQVDSPDELSPMALGLVDGLGGGALSIGRPR